MITRGFSFSESFGESGWWDSSERTRKHLRDRRNARVAFPVYRQDPSPFCTHPEAPGRKCPGLLSFHPMFRPACHDRLFFLVRALAIMALASRTLAPLAHGPRASGSRNLVNTVVVSADATGHDHDPSTCPVCNAVRDSLSGAIEASPFLVDAAVSQGPCTRDISFLLVRCFDLSTGAPRAPPAC